MIVLDVNLLLYTYNSYFPQHTKARRWFEQALREEAMIGLPWQTVWAFLRIATNRTLHAQCIEMSEAIRVVNLWLAEPNVFLLTPGDGFWPILQRLLIEGQVRGPLVTDAQLAALAIERGATLHTADRDFARFPGLRWRNPLA